MLLAAALSRRAAAPTHRLFPGAGAANDRVFRVRQLFDLIGCAPDR